MFRFIPVAACFLIFAHLSGQNALPIGQWRSHLPYSYGQWVTQNESTVFWGTRWSLVTMDKEERSVRRFTTTEGLSETGIRLLRYHPGSNLLIIAYDSGLIDLWQDGKVVVSIPQFKNFVNLPGEKSINDIFPLDGGRALLATSLGFSILNVETAKLEATTFTGVPVNAVALWQGDYYIATGEGIYRVASDEAFVEEFGRWQRLDAGEGFPEDYGTHAMAVYDGKLYLDIDDNLFLYDGTNAPQLVFAPESGLYTRYISAGPTHLLAGYGCNGGSCGGRGRAFWFAPDGGSGELSAGCIGDPYYGVEDDKGRIWFGDKWRTFRMLNGVNDSFCNITELNSPFSESVWSLAAGNGQVWLASGALNQTLSPTFKVDGVAVLKDGNWTIYNRENNETMRGEDKNTQTGRDDDLFDMIAVTINPVNGKVYAASFLEGIVEFDGDQLTLYNEKNSSLQQALNEEKRTKIGGLAFDQDGNLWVANHSAASGKSISVFTANGNWLNFGQTCSQTALFQVGVDNNNYKWFIIGNGQAGVMVFDSGILEDPSDDRCRVFSSTNSNLPTNTTNCLAVDLDGDVWVGTDQGVTIFECGASAFDEACKGTRRIVESDRDGFGAYLLETQNVTAIAVDGANRKWVGTSNGVFLLSPDGKTEIHHFTKDNSPLFDNAIYSIAVDQESGEVFIGTAKGLISYQSDAIEGGRVNRKDVLVFPNPVRPEYDGPIAIKGLARNASVKITDVNGRLVYETEALGGQAVWDGRDYRGRKAQSGVYLVFAATNPSEIGFGKADGAVAKILIIN